MCLHEKARQYIVNMYIMITKSRNLYIYFLIKSQSLKTTGGTPFFNTA